MLDAVCRALRLDEAERAHLLDLMRTANADKPQRRTAAPQRICPSIGRIVDSMAGVPAFVRNGRFDILHANQLATALYSEHFRDAVRPANSARFVFLDPRASSFYVDWETTAHDIVATLRGEAGRNPYDRALSDLIGLLSTRSDEFRVRWASHDVRFHRTGSKRLHHPLVGELTLAYESLELPADPGLTIVTYSAEPGSPSEEALLELGRWAATRAKLSAVDTEARWLSAAPFLRCRHAESGHSGRAVQDHPRSGRSTSTRRAPRRGRSSVGWAPRGHLLEWSGREESNRP